MPGSDAYRQPEASAEDCPYCKERLYTPRWCWGCHFPGQHAHRTCSGCQTRFIGSGFNVSPAAKSEPPEAEGT